jgi:RNA polymerase sigma-70 factor (ECF subfamily)
MREVLVAVDILGLSYKEAGKALGVHENTIPTRLARARLKVAEAVQG